MANDKEHEHRERLTLAVRPDVLALVRYAALTEGIGTRDKATDLILAGLRSQGYVAPETTDTPLVFAEPGR